MQDSATGISKRKGWATSKKYHGTKRYLTVTEALLGQILSCEVDTSS